MGIGCGLKTPGQDPTGEKGRDPVGEKGRDPVPRRCKTTTVFSSNPPQDPDRRQGSSAWNRKDVLLLSKKAKNTPAWSGASRPP